MSDMRFFLAALFGSTFQEIVHWYDLRDKLTLDKYQAMLRSAPYWAVTILMIFGSAVGCILWKNGVTSRYTLFDFAIFGAAFPLIFKRIVRGVDIVGKTRKLGPTDSLASTRNVVAWYFDWRS